MTPTKEEQLVEAIEQAVKTGISPHCSTRSGACVVCGGGIAIGKPVVELPGKWTVCGDCFECFTISPGPRPME